MPKPTYQIKSYRGKPTLFMDGEPTPAYLYSHSLPIDRPGAERAQRRFVEHGCKFHMATIRGGVDGDWFTTEFWTDDNVFPDITQPDEVLRGAAYLVGVTKWQGKVILLVDLTGFLRGEESAGLQRVHERVEIKKKETP